MRRIFFLLPLLFTFWTIVVQPAQHGHAASMATPSGETRAALEKLVTFFVRHAGTQLSDPPEESVLIRLGAAAVFRHFAMDGLLECAPTNNPDQENDFLLAPQCVTMAVQRLTGHTLSKHRSVPGCQYTENGYSVPLPTERDVSTTVVDGIARQDADRYAIKGYILRYAGKIDDLHDLKCSLTFTAVAEHVEGRWRLLSLQTTAQQRPVATTLREVLPGTDRSALLRQGAIPLEDPQALWVSVELDGTLWQGRAQLHRDKVLSVVLEAPVTAAQGLDAQLRRNNFVPVELLQGKRKETHRAMQTGAQHQDARKEQVLHFYATQLKEGSEPAQLLYISQNGLEKKARTASPVFRVLVEKKQRLQMSVTRR